MTRDEELQPRRVAMLSKSSMHWFLRGARGVASVPALILMTSMVGFGVLCRESGVTLGQAMFMTGTIWALPSQVILVGSIATGASLFTTAIGVSLSAVRFAPMIASWVTIVRSEKTPQWQYLVLSHVVAVTSYLFSALHMPRMAPETRIPYFTGFAVTLTALNVGVTGASYLLAGALPTVLAGALFFVTPVYFLTALTATATITAERLALALGVVLGPVFAATGLPLALVWAGVLGGGLAYLGGRFARRQA